MIGFIISGLCVCICPYCLTLTLQNVLLGKAKGSKSFQTWSQTQPVHLLVSSPIKTSLFPVGTFEQTKQTLREPCIQKKKWNEIIRLCSNVICTNNKTCMTLGTYCQDGNEPSRLFTKQLTQLLFGKGVHNETEDEEGGQDNTQSPTQEWVKTDAFVVRHLSSACEQMKSGFNIIFSFTGNIRTFYLVTLLPPVILLTGKLALAKKKLNRVAHANLSFSSLLLMVVQMRSESFSSWSKVFWTAWLMVFSMVWQIPSIWFTHRLG